MKTDRYSFIALLWCAVLTSCSWVKDDLSDCPTGQWLQLEYTCNMLDIDASDSQIDDACVFVYDSLGTYVKQIQVNRTELTMNGYRIEINGLSEGAYTFMVWSGLSDLHYLVSNTTKLSDFILCLTSDTKGECSDDLQNLFYGNSGKVIIDKKYAVHRVSMIKDTNRIACLIKAGSDKGSVNTGNYTMELIAQNAKINSSNLNASNEQICYLPHISRDTTIVDADGLSYPMMEFSLTSLRLFENDNARLILKQKDTDFEVFNIPVSQFIAEVASLYKINGRTPTAQEYLDRQDLFSFVFSLSSDNKALMRCEVNNWIVRNSDKVEF